MSVCSNVPSHVNPIHHTIQQDDPQQSVDKMTETLLSQQATKMVLLETKFTHQIKTLNERIRMHEQELGIVVAHDDDASDGDGVDDGDEEILVEREEGGGGGGGDV